MNSPSKTACTNGGNVNKRKATRQVKSPVALLFLLLSTLCHLAPSNCVGLPAGFGQASYHPSSSLLMELAHEGAAVAGRQHSPSSSSQVRWQPAGRLQGRRRSVRASLHASDDYNNNGGHDVVIDDNKDETASFTRPSLLDHQQEYPKEEGEAMIVESTETTSTQTTNDSSITTTPSLINDDLDEDASQKFIVASVQSQGMTTSRPSHLNNMALVASMRFKDLIPPTYDRLKWPAPEDGSPVRVSVAVALGKLHSVDEAQKTVTFDMCLELAWREPRLRLPRNLSEAEAIPLPAELIKLLWTPDPYILNLRSLDSASVVKPPTGLEISGDKTVRMTLLRAATIGCSMDFREYPVDTQVCRVRIQSFEYEIEDLTFEWGAALGNFAKLGTEDFIVETILLEPYNKTYLGSSSMWNGKRFSRLEFRLVLQRRFSYHLLETYLPSVLFTMCAWLSFLVPRSSIPGRMALCVTTLLSMTAMVAAVKKFTPHSQYIKAIEVWLLTCLCFIFYALFAFLLAIKIASFEKTIKRARAIRRRSSPNSMKNKASIRRPPSSAPTVRYAVSSNSTPSVDRNSSGNNVEIDMGEDDENGPMPISIIHQGTTLPIGVAPSDFFRRATSPSVAVDAVNPWKRRADWFEFASFIGYAVAFVIFAIWYWSKLLEASEHYKFFVPRHD